VPLQDEKPDGSKAEGTPSGREISRRQFLDALGGSAIAALLMQGGGGRDARAQSATYWYYDSWGNVVAVNPEVIDAGVYPPPLPEGVTPPTEGSPPSGPDLCAEGTYVTGGYHQPNFLLLMVDQLRAPRWLTSGQMAAFQQSIMPNLFGSGGLMSKSYWFPNFFTAATNCTPARATLLTGLYAQQTCIYKVQGYTKNTRTGANNVIPPSLLPYNGGSGFATIGDVLSQRLPINCNGSSQSPAYNCAWIGKWHVSDFNFGEDPVGGNGPWDYGFQSVYNVPTPPSGPSTPPYSIPFPYAYPSPNGVQNEGSGGDLLGVNNTAAMVAPAPPAFTYNTLATPGDPVDVNAHTLNISNRTPFTQLNDPAIYHAFQQYWLQNMPGDPWFLAVSFVNPHDMSDFPWAYGLATNASGEACGGSNDFGCAASPASYGFYPPPVLGWNDNAVPGAANLISFNGLPYLLYNSHTSPANTAPSDWNYNDNPYDNPYSSTPHGKPDMQAYFEYTVGLGEGTVNDEDPGWYTFLNYYYWMQSAVDTLIGRVLDDVYGQYTNHNDYPVVIFTSDHGDYGGSHWLHAKGGALYDESLNVPLLIRIKGQNSAAAMTSDFTCSSVDILPFIYEAALGNGSWRNSPNDMISYLNQRESIYDALFTTPAQRRVAPYTNAGGFGGIGPPLPYVLHTMDEYANCYPANALGTYGGFSPSHAIAFRTVDNSVAYQDQSGRKIYAGAKLGMYTYWVPNTTWPDVTQASQFEFYEYNPPANNYGETGNNAFDRFGNWQAAYSGVYVNSYNNIMAAELYAIDPKIQNAHATAFNAYMAFLYNTVRNYPLWTGGPPGGSPNTIPWPSP
jgi:Sulfatase